MRNHFFIVFKIQGGLIAAPLYFLALLTTPLIPTIERLSSPRQFLCEVIALGKIRVVYPFKTIFNISPRLDLGEIL